MKTNVLAWMFGILLLLGEHASGLERLGMPVRLEGNPKLEVDFNFSPAKDGKVLVQMALGGQFADIQVPAGAKRPPRFEVHCGFYAQDAVQVLALAKGGVINLQDVLDSGQMAFSPKL